MIRPIVVVALCASASLAFGQTIGDPRVPIQGRVLADDGNGIPLPGAQVLVTVPNGGTEVATSDRAGQFEVRVPVSGDWSLRVTKAGYAPVERGAADLSNGPAFVRLPRGAAVTGRVVNQYGDPVPSLAIRVTACSNDCDSTAAPSTAVALFASTTTDDRGEYRIGSLPAGWYQVRVGSAIVGAVAAQRIETTRTLAASGLVSERTLRDTLNTLVTEPDPPDAVVRLRTGEEAALHFTHEEEAGRNQTAARALVAARAAAEARARAAGAPATDDRPTGVIKGHVLGPTGRPVSGARVQATSVEPSAPRAATSDAEGRYELTGVPPGSYRLRVSASGYQPVEYGQRRALQQGTTIPLRDGQTIEGIDIRLPPGGVIAGRVTDEYGEPLEGLAVQVHERRYQEGRLTLVPMAGAATRLTNDRGEYRIFGLLPGTFYITVSRTPSSSRASFAADGTIVFAMTGNTEPAQLAAALRAAGTVGVEQVAVTARPDGANRVSVTAVSASLPRTTGDSPPVYAPGTTSPGEAVPVRIEPGFDAYGIDVTFVEQSGVRVLGMVTNAPDGAQVGRVSMLPSYRSGAVAARPRETALQLDGTFEFTNVAPGDYLLVVSSQRGSMSRDGGGTARVRFTIQSREPLAGLALVTVSGTEDVTVTIPTSAGSRVTGQVNVEGDATVSPSRFRLEAVPADRDRARWIGELLAPVNAEGTFQMNGLIGPMRLRLAQAPPGWYLKTALVNGIDAAEFPVTLDSALVPGADVLVAPGGEISGRAVDDRREPAHDYSVVVFSTNPTRWWERSPYVRLARSTTEGSFSVDGLPPGEYWAAAVEQIDGDAASGEWQDPDLLNRLVAGAQRLQVGAGQQATTELRVTRLIR